MGNTRKISLFTAATVTLIIAVIAICSVFAAADRTDNNGNILQNGGSSPLSLTTVTPGEDSELGRLGVQSQIPVPGQVSSPYNYGTEIRSAADLDNALKQSSGEYYLSQDITYTASAGSTSAVVYGNFGGVLYGNGHTVTVTVNDGTSYDASQGNGTYGFLVKALAGGTIRDLNLVVSSNQVYTKFGIKLGSMTYTSQPEVNRGTDQAYMARIGGMVGNIYDDGVIYNCSVTFTGNLALVNNGAVPGSSNAVVWGKNCVFYFGGIAGGVEGGNIAYTNVNYNGNVINSGQLTRGGSNMMIATGGVVGQVNGVAKMRKISVQGSGIIASEGHLYSAFTTSVPSSDSYTGGVVGWITKNGSLDLNGLYLNLKQYSTSSEGAPWGGTDNMSQGNSGAVKNYFYQAGGCAGSLGLTTWYDSVQNDSSRNYSSSENAHMMRSSYGVGAAQNGVSVSIYNVYVSQQMDNVIRNHHPYAVNFIQNGASGVSKNNSVWEKYRWTYNIVSATNGIADFGFAPYTGIGAGASGSGITGQMDNQKAVYLAYNNNSKTNFVYSVTQGNDVYNLYNLTYDKTGKIYVPVNYTGYNGSNEAQIVISSNLVQRDKNNYTPGIVVETQVSHGEWLDIDYDMTTSYNGTDRLDNGYAGSGNQYAYTYDGNYMYVPAFAGYASSGKINLSVDEQNALTGGVNNIVLKSVSTVVSAQEQTYTVNNYKYVNAGNVGNYVLSFNKPSNAQKLFIQKDGKNYYCNLKESYEDISVTVIPFSTQVVWTGTNDLKYDNTNKQIKAQISSHVAGNELGNNDSALMGLNISFDCADKGMMPGNLPFHAGDYTATASLVYDRSEANAKKGNYTLANESEAFAIAKRTIQLEAEEVSSIYGSNDHAQAVAAAAISITGGDGFATDEHRDLFTFRAVPGEEVTINSDAGDYNTRIEVIASDQASEFIVNDYDFVAVTGIMHILPRKINGTLQINGGIYDKTDRYGAKLTLDDDVRFGNDRVYTLSYSKDGQSYDKITDAGVYNIVISAERNYETGKIVVGDTLYVNGETQVEIQKRKVNITLSFDNGYVYDGKNKVTGYTFAQADETSGVVEGDSVTPSFTYNGEAEAILPDNYTASATLDNSNYAVGEITGGTFTVEKAQLSGIEAVSAEAIYDGTAKELGYLLKGVAEGEDIGALVGEVTVMYNSSTDKPSQAGEYQVTVEVKAGRAYEAATFTGLKFVINKADVQLGAEGVSESAKTSVYNGKVQNAVVTLSAPGMDNPQDFMGYVSVSSDKGEIKNAGQYAVSITFEGTNNYNAAQLEFVWTVEKAQLTVTGDQDGKYVYNAKAQKPFYEVNTVFAGDVYGEVTESVTGDNVTDASAVNAGTYTLTVNIAESANYKEASYSVEFTITPFELSLIADETQYITFEEGLTVNDYLAKVKAEMASNPDSVTIGDTVATTSIDGGQQVSGERTEFTVTYTYNSNANCTFADAVITVVVLKAQFQIKVNGEVREEVAFGGVFGEQLTVEASATFDGSEQTVSTEWFVKTENGYEATADVTDAGEYKAVFSFTTTVSGEEEKITRAVFVTVSPKDVKVTLDGSAVVNVYGDEPSTDGAVAVTDAEGVTVEVEFTTTAQKYSHAGDYALKGQVTAVSKDGAQGKISNYNFTVVEGVITVRPRTVYVKADDVTVTYGDEVRIGSYKVYDDDGATEWNGYAGAQQLNVSASVQSGILTVNEEGYEITLSENGSNPDYVVVNTTEKGKVFVNKRNITVKIAEFAFEYGTAQLPEQFRASIVSGNLVYGDTLGQLTVVYKGSGELSALGVNTYVLTDYADITAEIISENGGINYNISYSSESVFEITPKRVSIVFNGWTDGENYAEADKTVYNTKTWTPDFSIEGIINSDDVTAEYGYAADAVKDAGVYRAQFALAGTQAGNYVLDDYACTLTIEKAKTEIGGFEAGGYVYVYGDEKQAVNPSVTLIGDDTDDGEMTVSYYVGDNTSVTGIKVDYASKWDAGTYTAVISYQSRNYYADEARFTITVNQKTVSVGDISGITDLGSKVYDAAVRNVTVDELVTGGALADEIRDYLQVVYIRDGVEKSYMKDAGVFGVNVRLVDNMNYRTDEKYLLEQNATYTITKASSDRLSFMLTVLNRVYDGSDLTDFVRDSIVIMGINNETVSGGERTITAVMTGKSENVQIIEAGAYKVTFAVSGLTNYEDVSGVALEDTFTVDKVALILDTMTVKDVNTVYDGNLHSVNVQGLPQNVVLLGTEYRYGGEVIEGITDATADGGIEVEIKIYFDAANSSVDRDLPVVDYNGTQAYELVLTSNLTVQKAAPSIKTDSNTRAYYFDGKSHDIDFEIKGAGTDADAKGYTFNLSDGLSSYDLGEMGSIKVTYYTDKDYTNALTDSDGNPLNPLQVLRNGDNYAAYYLKVEFIPKDANYAQTVFTDKNKEMTLVILPSAITLEFSKLTAEYGTFASRDEINEFVQKNMKFDFYIDEVQDTSAFDIDSMIDIIYNVDTEVSLNVGKIKIGVLAMPKAGYASSCSVVVAGADDVTLEITPAQVTDDITSVFGNVSSVYGEKTYSSAADFGWTNPVGAYGETLGYSVTYGGSEQFSIANAGEYKIQVAVNSPNYKPWTGTYTLTVDKAPVTVEYTLDGKLPDNGVFVKEYDSLPAGIEVNVKGVEGLTATCEYYREDGTLSPDGKDVGEYTVKAVLSDSNNYYVDEASASVRLTVEPSNIDEEQIRGWISNTTAVYGSVKGLDISGVPAQYNVTVTYEKDGKTYDSDTIKRVGVGEYTANVTVSDGVSQGQATFLLTVTKLTVNIKVDISATFGKLPVAKDVILTATPSLPNGDTVTVNEMVLSSYPTDLAVGYYKVKDYVVSVTLGFTNAENYEYTVEYGTLTVNPQNAPVIKESGSTYNTITLKMDKADVYAYRLGTKGEWIYVSGVTDTIKIEGLEADTAYTVQIAYGVFTSKYVSSRISTTYDPNVLKTRIEELLEGGLTEDETAQYEELSGIYNKQIAEADKEIVKDKYEEMVNAFLNLGKGGDEGGLGVLEIVVITLSAVVAFAAIVAVIVVFIIKKKSLLKV